MAHILHSSITEGYKKITINKEVIEKNRKIATKYHKSYAFKYSLEEEHKPQAPRQSVFSWMGFLLNKRRLSLSGESVTMQLFLQDNLEL